MPDTDTKTTDTHTLPDDDHRLAAQLPPLILEGLRNYVLHHEPTGSFLDAVLSNDLMMAVGRADPESLAALGAIARYVHWVLPSACHGTKERVQAWLNRRQLQV